MSQPDASHRAQPIPAELADAVRLAGSRLRIFGGQLEWHAVVTSTNDIAAERAEQGAAEGRVVIAGSQTAGRGRRGRAWSSPPGTGLYASIVLRPDTRSASLLTIAAGVAVAEGIAAATGLEPTLKWPNDLTVGPRKLAGILAEGSVSSSGVSHVILGFGVNVRDGAWPPEVAARATSIAGETARDVDRGVVLVECLAALASRYDELTSGRSEGVVAAWRSRATTLFGRAIQWDGPRGVEQGTAEDVDSSGALMVRTTSGVSRVVSGEVRWM